MKKFMKKMKNKKGFTLVEIIVVLLILAILAAASIPTMLGFVNDAKGKAEIANARAAYVAAQMIATEEQATGATSTLSGQKTIGTTTSRIDQLLGADLEDAKFTATVADGKITNFVYVSADGEYTVTIAPGSAATVTKN